MAGRSPRARSFAVVIVVALAATLAMGLAACGSTPPGPTSSPGPSSRSIEPIFPLGSPVATPAVSRAPATPAPPRLGPRIGTTGAVVVLGEDGALWLTDAGGRTVVLASADEGSFTFPAWSPDGSRIAAIRYGAADSTILVFDAVAAMAGSGGPAEPTVVLRSATIGPFYLSWSPDGRNISYLASEANGLSLRLAPADGSAPIDGSGPGAIIGSGDPFYFDWIDRDRLLAHVGTGPGAFLGEIGLDGEPAGASVGSLGAFRSAVVSPDRSLVSYVGVDDAGASQVVVAGRDGADPRTLPVFGPAAVAFDPTGELVATIGATTAPVEPLVIPVGPLRLLDPSGGAGRTLLDGTVVSFWWSPDGATIAALRAQPAERTAALAAASAVPSPVVDNEVRLVFVDVATGDVRSEAVVTPGRTFIDQVLTYFDQYALSHRLWSPDSASFLLPLVAPDGATHVAVMPRDGGEPVLLDGQVGFWSP